MARHSIPALCMYCTSIPSMKKSTLGHTGRRRIGKKQSLRLRFDVPRFCVCGSTINTMPDIDKKNSAISGEIEDMFRLVLRTSQNWRFKCYAPNFFPLTVSNRSIFRSLPSRASYSGIVPVVEDHDMYSWGCFLEAVSGLVYLSRPPPPPHSFFSFCSVTLLLVLSYEALATRGAPRNDAEQQAVRMCALRGPLGRLLISIFISILISILRMRTSYQY